MTRAPIPTYEQQNLAQGALDPANAPQVRYEGTGQGARRLAGAIQAAGDFHRQGVERQEQVNNELWMTQASSAAQLKAQGIYDSAITSVEPGSSVLTTLEKQWKQQSDEQLKTVTNPELKNRLSLELENIKKNLLLKGQQFDTVEKTRYGMQNFEGAVQNKARFYGGLGASQVDRQAETDVGELTSLVKKVAATPAERQKMLEFMTQNITEAANLRKIEADPEGYLAAHALARNPVARLTDPDMPVGIRNNNPGNLRGGDAWMGKTGVDKNGYVQFQSPDDGLRAMAINLKNQQQKHGLSTVAEIITKYAPPSDNNPTNSYILNVADAMQVKPDERINLNDPQVLATMMTAMIRQENGTQPYAPGNILWAANAAAQPEKAGQPPNMVRDDGSIRAASTVWNFGTYEQQRNWIEKAESAIRQKRAQQNQVVAQGNELIRTVHDRMERGLPIPAEELQMIDQQVKTSGSPELLNRWLTTQDQHGSMQGYMRMTPAQLRSHIDTVLQPQVQQGGATEQEAARLEIAQKTLGTMETQLNADPLGWYQRTGGQVPALDFNKPQDLQMRRALSHTLAETYSIPLSKTFFTPQEATQFVNNVKAATPDVQIKAALGFANAFGKDVDEAAAIFEKDVPLFGYAASMLSVNPAATKTANDMLVGERVLAEDKGAGIDKTKFDAEMQNWEGYFGNPQVQALVKKAATSVYAARNYGKPFDADALSTAMEEVVGGERARVGNTKVITPPGVSGDAFEDWVGTLTQDRLKALMGGHLPNYKNVIFDPQKHAVNLRTIGPGLYQMMGDDGLPLAGRGPGGIAILELTPQDVFNDKEAVENSRRQKSIETYNPPLL